LIPRGPASYHKSHACFKGTQNEARLRGRKARVKRA
jgi:hypothetical protein